MLKTQTTLEYIIVLAVVVLIGVGFFYFYISSVNHQKPVPEIIIDNLQINNFSSGTTNCNVGLSFQSTSDAFTANQFNILAQNYTGSQFNISISTNSFSYYSTPENNYQFNYQFTASNTTFCNMFTQFVSSTSGEITGLLIYVNGTQELYQFNPPIKMTSQQ